MRFNVTKITKAILLSGVLFSALPAHAAFEKVVYADDFGGGVQQANGVTAALSGGITQSSQGFANYGYGSHMFTLDHTKIDGVLTLFLDGLPTHSHINIGGLLAVINSWDGSQGSEHYNNDLLSVSVDGTNIFTTTFSLFDLSVVQGMGQRLTPEAGEDLFRIPSDPVSWTEQAYDFTHFAPLTNIAHTGSSLTLQFKAHGTGWQGFYDESFGLGSVRVSVLSEVAFSNAQADVSAPLLGGAGMLALAFAGWRRRQA